ncbi:MAG: hypothetical protein OXC70_05115 [Gammaproteobacteria bacterium]|nr:hypothetical protein [Gammaproteobacteria bacterium]
MKSESLSGLTQAIKGGADYWKSKKLGRPYLEEVVLEKLQQAILDIVPDIKERHKVPADPNKKGRAASVHYTTIGVLMQLLQDQDRAASSEKQITLGKLRLYDSMHLNDPDEGNYLPRRIAAEPNYAWLAERRDNLEQDEIEGPLNQIAYMTSFVAGKKATDNLVFWRTYGCEGTGCSIECSVEIKYLQQVLYGDAVIRTIEILQPILDSLTPIVEATDDSVRGLLAATVWSSLRNVLHLYKSSAYDYENERRYVLLSSEVKDADICYEYQDKPFGLPRIRHYLERPELDFNDLLPSGSVITIGPCVPQPNHVRRRLSILANRALQGRPEIRTSGIPYRQV